jgi:epoxyqueuosine reductase QueG
MIKANSSEEIRKMIIKWGASKVGFADLKDFIPVEYGHLRNAISIAVRLSDSVIDEVLRGPTKKYAANYHVVNAILTSLALNTSKLIRSFGYEAFPVPVSQVADKNELNAIVSHKTAATRAGLGWIGKNALLVTPEFGPRVRLVTILTDYPFQSIPPIEKDQCNDCLKCAEICPAKAIRGNHWQIGVERNALIDVHLCNELIEKNKIIFNAPICGQCVSVCPAGKNL